MSSSERTVEELRRESERNRTALSAVAADLRLKLEDTTEDVKTLVSPTKIRADVKDYVRTTSDQVVHRLQQRARDNPLQALAIGAGLAYSSWGLLRSIPTPLLLMGAGCWLASRSGRDSVQRLSHQVTERAGDLAEDLKEQAGDLAQGMRERAGDVAQGIKEHATAVGDRAREMADKAVGTAKGAVATATDKIHEPLRTISDGSVATLAPVADMARDGMQAVSATKDQVLDAGRRAGSAVSRTAENHPLALAGVGLAIGAIIAAALPRSDVERRVVGQAGALAGAVAKDKIAQAAGGLLDRAGAMVDHALERMSEKASQQGLSPDAVAKKADNLTDNVRAVVNRGVDAALGVDGQRSGDEAQRSAKGWENGTEPAHQAGERQRIG